MHEKKKQLISNFVCLIFLFNKSVRTIKLNSFQVFSRVVYNYEFTPLCMQCNVHKHMWSSLWRRCQHFLVLLNLFYFILLNVRLARIPNKLRLFRYEKGCIEPSEKMDIACYVSNCYNINAHMKIALIFGKKFFVDKISKYFKATIGYLLNWVSKFRYSEIYSLKKNDLDNMYPTIKSIYIYHKLYINESIIDSTSALESPVILNGL